MDARNTMQPEVPDPDLPTQAVRVADGETLDALIKLIVSPGWAARSHAVPVSGVAEAMSAYIKAVSGLKQVLIMGRPFGTPA